MLQTFETPTNIGGLRIRLETAVLNEANKIAVYTKKKHWNNFIRNYFGERNVGLSIEKVINNATDSQLLLMAREAELKY